MFSEIKKGDILICTNIENWSTNREFIFTGEFEGNFGIFYYINENGKEDKVKINNEQLLKHFDYRSKRIDMII